MALKRVSDLEHKTLSDITTYINDMYGNGVNMEKLPKSLIEVSEVLDQHHSQYESYAYDLQALSAIFIDGVLNRDITFTGNKTFNGDMVVNGALGIYGQDEYDSLFCDTGEIYLNSKNDAVLSATNNANLCSNNDVSLLAKGVIYEKGKEIDLVVDKPDADAASNGIGRIIMTTDDHGRSEVNIHADTIKFHVTKEFGVYSNNVGMFNILYDNGNGYNDPPSLDITKFNYSMDGTRSNNPLNGYINHALWS